MTVASAGVGVAISVFAGMVFVDFLFSTMCFHSSKH